MDVGKTVNSFTILKGIARFGGGFDVNFFAWLGS